MKKIYRNTMRKVARFILGFERCPTDYKRSFIDDLCELFLKLIFTTTFVFLMMAMVVSWG
jgi:hypothetical protein